MNKTMPTMMIAASPYVINVPGAPRHLRSPTFP